MKKIVFILLICFNISNLQSQNDKDLEKVKTINGTIKTLYSVISGEKGEERNWELFKFLFHKEAKLIPSGKNKAGIVGARYLTPGDYIKLSGNWLVKNGFHEVEISRKTDVFGNIAQVFSSYESFRSKRDKTPFMRGINSIQLLNDGNRWWIINIYWMQESKSNPIPKKHLN